MVASLQIPRKVWIELHQSEYDTPTSCDVLVQMEDDTIYTAHFVTLAYLRHQMELSFAVSQQMEYTPSVRYAALETPHLLVDEINRDVIEDTLDNLIALDVFEGLFTQVTESAAADDDEEPRTTMRTGTRATQEVAAVVLSDVLVVEAGD
ncbi:MAG: hypothetical protein AAFV33_10670 [Chloroflexota bacterium]